jgi:ribose 5-phosphate isomerase A
MSNEEGKRRAARAAMRFVEPGMIVGVGTGSTVALFHRRPGAISRDRIEAPSPVPNRAPPAQGTRHRGAATSTPPASSRCTWTAPTSATRTSCLIKGGGAALTREKIIAEASTPVRLHHRPQQAGPSARQVSAAGGSDPDGAQPGRARILASPAASRSGATAWSPTTATGSWTCTTCRIADPVALEASSTRSRRGHVGLFAARRADVVLTGEET